VIRSTIDYARSFAHGLIDPQARALLRAHRSPWAGSFVGDPQAALRSAVGYLLRAQQQGTDAGMGSYHLVRGWGASYPETTGYAIPTLIEAGKQLNWHGPLEAAQRAADWLLTIQHADGGWQGGRIGEERPSIVFNTAQVMRGLLAQYEQSKEDRYLSAAARAADWVMRVQDRDGAWRSSNFLGVARVYDTHVDAPLLRLHVLTGDPRSREAALRNLEWVRGQREPNGWFANCDNTVRHNDRPITHTIAYTLDGLLECGSILSDPSLVELAIPASLKLADLFLEHGTLHARYDRRWQGSEFPIMTGCAQLAIVWHELYELTRLQTYGQAYTRMVQLLMAAQARSAKGPEAIHGAMPGSYPIWGRYEKFAFPNWATKYMADALLCSRVALTSS
jgi:uncharacterized protein YyaL (SSP411 family)